MTTGPVLSWGRVHRPRQDTVSVRDRHQDLPLTSPGKTVLPYGNGRSYGDSNLNPNGTLLLARRLDRFIDFDRTTGVLTCEAGVLLSEIIQLTLGQGWFLPVTPGTQFITVGGAIANDVHGKNHHRAGSFGNHVLEFELLRSDGSRRRCSPTQHADWYAATIGGLGLTGLITWASIQLRPIANAFMDVETLRFRTLDEFFELSATSEADYEYTVSWIDCAHGGKHLGRGLFSRANHAPAMLDVDALPRIQYRVRRIPVTPPISLINPASLKLFNLAYYHRQIRQCVRSYQHYQPFFYPLDALLEWNRIYGPRGFYQYQSVIPCDQALSATRRMLEVIAASGMGSFLAVLKQFGNLPSPGLLSFPMPGITLALDFPNQGPRLHRMFEALDTIVMQAGGRLYPAKDGRMCARLFRSGFPRLEEFLPFVDPRFSSGFWQRVMETT